MGLEDYKEIVASSAAITTMGQMLSGTIICKNICQKGSTKGFDPMPFIGGIGMTVLMLQYAWILGDPAMINVNIFGMLTNLVYLSVFYIYDNDKVRTVGLVGKAVALVAIILGYAQWEDPTVLSFRFGLIVTALLLLLISSPLMHLGEVIKTKNTDILPFPLIVMGTLVSFQWLLYGFIIDNAFVIFQNGVGLTLYIAQLSLFAIFPSSSKTSAEHSSSKKDK